MANLAVDLGRTEFEESITKLSRDLLVAARTLSHDEARFLVDLYYLQQEHRKRSNNQVRALMESGEPHTVLRWFAEQGETLEKRVASVLKSYADAHPTGEWLQEIDGIGPIIAAGLLAHIDITKSPTVGHIWRFAGLDPTSKWEKGQKRPWNAALKTLCWKIGESFVKVSNKDTAFYGRLYKERKELEIQRNEAGAFAEQAKAAIEKKKIGKDTEAYKAYSVGRLPPAHIHARAKRYAVKRFLIDTHTVWYWIEFSTLPPKPFVFEHAGHAHYEMSSSFDRVPGLRDAITKFWQATL